MQGKLFARRRLAVSSMAGVCRYLALLAINLSPLAHQAAVGSDWPQFRGPSQQGRITTREVPLSWSRDTNVAWRTPLNGTAWSQPVVSRGNVYLTTAVSQADSRPELIGDKKTTDSPISLRVMCLDLNSGKMKWDVEVSTVPPGTAIHPKNSHASPTPIVMNNKLFFHFGSNGTGAMDLEGKILWKTKLDYEPFHGSGGSPTPFENLLIINCDGNDTAFIVALDNENGEEVWRSPRRDALGTKTFSFSTPLVIEVAGASQVISAASQRVYAYDPRSGKEIWRVTYPDQYSVIPRPVYAYGLVFACTGYDGPPEILAIRPDGSGDVTETHVAWHRKGQVPFTASPVAANEHIFLVSDNGIASCRETTKGDLVWAERLGGNYSASPIASDEHVYFLSEEGTCTIIKASPTFEIVGENDLGERCLASPVPIDAGLLIRTEAALYRIGK